MRSKCCSAATNRVGAQSDSGSTQCKWLRMKPVLGIARAEHRLMGDALLRRLEAGALTAQLLAPAFLGAWMHTKEGHRHP